MDKGFCRDQQRPRLFKSNIPINRDKFAGLICLHAFFCVRRAVNSSNLFYVPPPPTLHYNKKTAKPLVYTNVPIHTPGVLRAVLIALTNVYDGKKDIHTYARCLPCWVRTYISGADLYISNFSASTITFKTGFTSVTSLSTCSTARANNL